MSKTLKDVAFALKGHTINILKIEGSVRIRIDGVLAEQRFPDYPTAVAWMIDLFSNQAEA